MASSCTPSTASPCTACGGLRFLPGHARVLDFEYAAPGAYDYARCAGCGLLRIRPVPDAATLALAYPPDYHAYRPHTSPLARRLKDRYWRAKARAIARVAPPDAAILDLGCGGGDLLAALRDLGFRRLRGVEFNPEAARHARERGLDVATGEIDALDEPDGCYDVVSMVNFIEHVYDPAATLNRAARLLRPGGLVLGETPLAGTWDHVLFGRFWGGYHAPRHIHIFSRQSLDRVAQAAGLELASVGNLFQPAHWALSVQHLLHGSGLLSVSGGRSRLFLPLLLASAPVNLVQSWVSRTSLVEFAMTRPDSGAGA